MVGALAGYRDRMRIALVTGPTSGIGRAVALSLASQGFHLVAAGRSADRLKAIVSEIDAADGSAEPLLVDLASLRGVARAADEFIETGREIDVLVNNAGVAVARGTTEDGFQVQFGVNHLGHFMLTNRLVQTMRPSSRVVQVSSNMHYRVGHLDFDRLTRPTRSLFGVPEYSVSKLANVLFVREASRRHRPLGFHAVHPGLVDTGIFPRVLRPFLRGMVTPEAGADTVVWAATDPDLSSRSGGYYAGRTEREPSPAALDDRLAAELWERSEEWCRKAMGH